MRIRNSHSLIISCFTLLCISQSHSQTQSKIEAVVTALKNDKHLSNASWSVTVSKTANDSIILNHNSDLSLIPASTNKIITTATALAILGSKFSYETKIEYDGKIDTSTGILNGNIYIHGSGDPTLSSEVFRDSKATLSVIDTFAQAIEKAGIKKITGAIYGDAQEFEDERVSNTWIWGDMGNYYGAGTSGLNYLDNKFGIYFNSGSNVGDKTSISKIFPEIPGLEIINQTFTRGYSDNAYIFGAPYTLSRYVKGTIPANKRNFKVEGSQPDPPLLCAQHLDSVLRKLGIQTAQKPGTIRNFIPSADEYLTASDDSLTQENIPLVVKKQTDRLVIYAHTSPTLDKIVFETNMHSNNLYAESLLKTISWRKKQFGTDQAGISITENFWKNQNINLQGFVYADGCGLSRFNSITTGQLTAMLNYITRDSTLYKSFNNSLPIAGRSGSLASLCRGTKAENNLRGKSGYMSRVRSYAGYVQNKNGELLSFALIANNYTCSASEMKKKFEKLMVAIAESE